MGFQMIASSSKQVEIFTGRARTASEPYGDPSDDVDVVMDRVGGTERRQLQDGG